jgi:spermidine synthase
VWTAQIAVTLVALACGYYAGGRLSDRSQKLARLYWAILVAALYLALTVLICEPVAYWCLDFNLAVGSLLASTILFFLPLALLATTGPFLVRVITSSVSGVGGNVGRLTSISTLGSFVGTMAIGYLMIPFLPNSVTMYLTSIALVLVCAGYFAFHRQHAAVPLLVALVLAGLIGLRLHYTLGRDYKWVVQDFLGNSHFGQLQVVERRDGSCRYYLNDNLIQNTYDPERKQSVSHFTYTLAGLARCYVSNINDVLCIGLGVGIVPMDFAHARARVDVVEINPAVVPVGVRFFDLETNKIRLTLDDGRHFLNRCRKQYDAVILDAFLGDSSPSHLLTREAFASIHRVLRPGGALVINSFGHLEPGRDFFTASLDRTLKAVFRNVRLHTSGDGGMFFVASDASPLEFVHRPDLENVHPEVLDDTRTTYTHVVDVTDEDGRVLRDDYNPAEFYDARNREEVRRRLALGAKDM